MRYSDAGRILLTVSLVWLAQACSDHTPRLAQLPLDGVILAFGDSLTAGAGAASGESYPAQLARLSGHQVINAGRSGEISADGRQRLPALLDQQHPALLILCHGGNDLLRKLDPAALRKNLQAMIDAASSRSIPVLLLGVPKPGLFLSEAAPLYTELASANALAYEGEVIAAVESSAALKSDPIHPNAAGYHSIARAVFRRLQHSGALQ